MWLGVRGSECLSGGTLVAQFDYGRLSHCTKGVSFWLTIRRCFYFFKLASS